MKKSFVLFLSLFMMTSVHAESVTAMQCAAKGGELYSGGVQELTMMSNTAGSTGFYLVTYNDGRKEIYPLLDDSQADNEDEINNALIETLKLGFLSGKYIDVCSNNQYLISVSLY